MKNTGSCLCGNVAYEFQGEPFNQVFCYCSECQKATGTDKWFGLWVSTEHFKFTRGEPAYYTRQGSSGRDVHYRFCKDCGTTVCVEFTVANMYSVGAATVDKNAHYFPKMGLYTASAPPWAAYPDRMPKYEDLPPEFK